MRKVDPNAPDPNAFRQPEVGDSVMFCTDIDGDGWPEIRTGEIIEVHQDYIRIKNADDTFEVNPDWNTQISSGPLTIGRWKYL
jgi:hypothetical protein